MLGKVDWSVRMACKDCKERQIGCHTDCERYKQYKDMKKKEAKERMIKRIIDDFPRK